MYKCRKTDKPAIYKESGTPHHMWPHQISLPHKLRIFFRISLKDGVPLNSYQIKLPYQNSTSAEEDKSQ